RKAEPRVGLLPPDELGNDVLRELAISREPDPAASAEVIDEGESRWEEILELAETPAERAKLAAMSDDERHDLIRLYLAQRRADTTPVSRGDESPRAGYGDLTIGPRPGR